jgi:hypothetical protein
MGDFLLATTAFPFDTPEGTRAMLLENRRKMTGCDYRECYGIADSELTDWQRQHEGD